MSKNYYTYNVSDMHTMYIMQAKSEDNKVIDKSNMNPRAGTKLVNILGPNKFFNVEFNFLFLSLRLFMIFSKLHSWKVARYIVN